MSDDLSDHQKHAMAAIKEYHDDPGDNLWMHVHPKKLANQLEARVRHPHAINQRQSHWCGPAAVCATMAHHAPTTYVRMIIDLVRHGKATVRHGELHNHT